jgi:hypothetical protein
MPNPPSANATVPQPRPPNRHFAARSSTTRAIISDIVSDEPVPEALQRDPVLWSF